MAIRLASTHGAVRGRYAEHHADYYESAEIDGASSWVKFWNVTVPLLWDTIRTAIVFLAIGAMDLFSR
ncbi:MAG: ABC transporter permease subunit [Kouleothrix sp.]